jgi:hypothetical protein
MRDEAERPTTWWDWFEDCVLECDNEFKGFIRFLLGFFAVLLAIVGACATVIWLWPFSGLLLAVAIFLLVRWAIT